MENNMVSTRLIQLIESLAEGTESKFASILGVSPAVINNYTRGKQQSKPSFDILLKMLEHYPQINLEWLVSGRGAMLKIESLPTERFIVSTQDTSGNLTVPIINRAAAANYRTGVQSQEYFEQLDSMQLPSSFLRGKQFYAVQIDGNSMNPTLHHNDLVICSPVDPMAWENIANNEVCVVGSTQNGLQVKRIKNKLRENGTLVCRSDNRTHPTFSIQQGEIIEVWKVHCKVSDHLDDDTEDFYDRITEIEARLVKMERKED